MRPEHRPACQHIDAPSLKIQSVRRGVHAQSQLPEAEA